MHQGKHSPGLSSDVLLLRKAAVHRLPSSLHMPVLVYQLRCLAAVKLSTFQTVASGVMQ